MCKQAVVSCFLQFFFFLISGCAVALSMNDAPPKTSVGNISMVDDAEYFRIYYGQAFKVIKNLVDGKSYLLIQSNSKMKTGTHYCMGRIKSFIVPLANYSVDTLEFPVSFFELLGLVDTLKGITSDSITSACILKSYMNGNIEIVNQSDITQLSKFTAHFSSSSSWEHSCNFISFLPFEEDAPLQRAEWIKYLGVFTNSEARANQVFETVKENYLCLKNSVAERVTSFKPIVSWFRYEEGIWHVIKDFYKLKFVTDAGGESVNNKISKNSYNISVPEDVDEFHAILCTIDIMIDETYTPEPENYTLSNFLDNINVEDHSCFSFLANKNVWRYDKKIRSPNALDWFNGGMSQPQLVLADLIEAFYPTINYTTTYFRNLAKKEAITSITADICDTDVSMPMEPKTVPCA